MQKFSHITGHWFALYYPEIRVTSYQVETRLKAAGETRPGEFMKEAVGKNKSQRIGSKAVRNVYPAIYKWATMNDLDPMDWILIRIKGATGLLPTISLSDLETVRKIEGLSRLGL